MRGPRLWWVGLALAAVAANLFGLAAWRFLAAGSGRPEALLWHEPSPLRPAYDREQARYRDLDTRLRAGDPTASWSELQGSYIAQRDLYPELVRDEAERWRAAQRAEARVYLAAGWAGAILALAAAGLFLCYLLRWPAAEPGVAPQRNEPNR